MGLEALAPEYQTQYEALLPEIERAIREKNNARGMFYSGQAGDEEVRAKADLLAKLAAESAATSAREREGTRDRELREKILAEETKAGKRNALLSILGQGVGSAATLGGLSYLNRGGTAGANVIEHGGVKYLMDAKGGVTPINFPGGGPSSAMTPVPNFNPNVAGTGPMMPMPGGAPAAPAASMWSSPMASLASGALGGGLGYLGASQIGRKGNLGGDIGAGLGGLAGLGLMSKFGPAMLQNPWGAGLGALAGAFGGKMLGDLF